MTQRNPASLPDLTAELSQLGDLRVWSVIITIFGDAVMPREGVVPARALSAITDRLSIKPEALRVALYRLAKDGWITRAKSGRNSFYELSKTGRAEFLPASRRIYADGPKLHGPWRLAGLQPMAESKRAKNGQKLRDAGYQALSSVLYLGAAQAGPAPKGAFVMIGDLSDIPDWARESLAPVALQREYQDLDRLLRGFLPKLASLREPDPLDAVALRIILVHQWRRLLLRHADLPPELMPRGWRGEECRVAVLKLHGLLSPLADPWLDMAIGSTIKPQQLVATGGG